MACLTEKPAVHCDFSLFTRFSFASLLLMFLAACGGGSPAGADNHSNADQGGVVHPPGEDAVRREAELAFIAGNIGGPGNYDGTGTNARFLGPRDIAQDSQGNLFVTEPDHVIRRISVSGEVTRYAGKSGQCGSRDGPIEDASFCGPSDIAVDADDNLYVVTYFDNQDVIRKISPAGDVSTVAGGGEQTGEGIPANQAKLRIADIAVDALGEIYIAGDYAIRRIDSSGIITTIAGQPGVKGYVDDAGTNARFMGPAGIALDDLGNIHVVDTASYSGNRYRHTNTTIRKISPSGLVSTVAGVPVDPVGQDLAGYADGYGESVRFALITDMTAGADGAVYVADRENNAIRRIAPDGEVTTAHRDTGRYTSASGYTAQVFTPSALVFSRSGELAFADATRHYIGRIDENGSKHIVAGMPGSDADWIVDGTGAEAAIYDPQSIAADAQGNIYLLDRTHIRRATLEGEVSTIYRRPASSGYGEDYDYFSGRINTDRFGNLLVPNVGGTAILRITRNGQRQLVAGSATEGGWSDGNVASARFNGAKAAVMDAHGIIYVSDRANHTIRRITPAGEVSTLAGLQGQKGDADGTGSLARFNEPTDLAIGPDGSVFVYDSRNNRIRKISPAGEVSTLLTDAAYGAPFSNAGDWNIGMTVDSEGSLYISDVGEATIRKILPSGEVMTVFTNGEQSGIRLGSESPGIYATNAITLVAPNTIALTSGSSLLSLTSNLIGSPW